LFSPNRDNSLNNCYPGLAQFHQKPLTYEHHTRQ
jgi:hypothetical protein